MLSCREKFLQFLACEEFSVDDAVQHKGDELNEKPSVVDISITGRAQSAPILLGFDEHEAFLLLVTHSVDVQDFRQIMP